MKIMISHNSDFLPLRSRLTEFLRQRHLRKTPERYAILAKAVDLSAHFDVDQLYNAMESEGYHVSRATVYNTLELLCEAGILNRHLFAPNQARYEVARGNHLHLICRRCGSIREIDDPELSARLLAREYPDFIPEYSSSSVYGLCANCRAKEEL
ncbi:MAG: transcriptional repressor [Bacteroides sp.]|nr:transcriptional repressor [Bacteroidales bacterium]MBD5295663.1 transcriptional repressor [Bacteroides sp.]